MELTAACESSAPSAESPAPCAWEIRHCQVERSADVSAAVDERAERTQEWAVGGAEVISLKQIGRRGADRDGCREAGRRRTGRIPVGVADKLVAGEYGRRDYRPTQRTDRVREPPELCRLAHAVRADLISGPVRAPVGSHGRLAEVREVVVG